MPSRKNPGEEKSLPCANIKLILKIPLSISTKKSIYEDFSLMVANEMSDTSKVIKNHIYKTLGVKDENSFNKLMKEPIDMARNKIYEKFNKTNGFSKEIEKFMISYLKKRGIKHEKD